MGYSVAVWKGWKAIPLLLEPVSGLWPEVTDRPAGTSGNTHQHGGGRGEDEEMNVKKLT